MIKKKIVTTKVDFYVLENGEPKKKNEDIPGKFTTEKGFRNAYKGNETIVYVERIYGSNEAVYEIPVEKFLTVAKKVEQSEQEDKPEAEN